MAYRIESLELEEQPILFIRSNVQKTEVAQALASCLPRVFEYAQSKGIALAGPPMCRYVESGPLLTLEAGMPVAVAAAGEGDIEAGVLPAGPTAKTTHAGPYDTLADAHRALEDWARAEGRTRAGAPWESYVTDPAALPDPRDWKTDVFLPLAR
jgi:AraC family transcriptional regulator